jgi:O-antigen/teichoic acid export membrane protein
VDTIGLAPLCIIWPVIRIYRNVCSCNEATGALGAIRNFVAPVSILLVSLMNYVLPYFSGIYAKKGDHAFKASLGSFFVIISLILLFYLTIINIFAEELLYLVYGKYSEFAIYIIVTVIRNCS